MQYSLHLLETSASPQQQKNEQRFVTLDIDATIPYVVVGEKLFNDASRLMPDA